ncbi:MAG: hypothetical protein A2219_06940, partial [Elusimicrobia bacterium RIFOXYA2_FULL_50_26]
MSTIIYCFSGTGNSLNVARETAKCLGDSKVVSISRAINSDIDLSADRIGIVFPVYVWGVPNIVCDFISKLKKSDKYFFSVVTFGGSPGKTNIQLKEMLRKQGIELKAGFGVKMPGNYIPMYGARPKEVQDKLFSEAKNKITSISEYIKNNKSGAIEAGGLIMNLLGSFAYTFGIKSMRKADKNFYADEKCDMCGICEKVCPVKNIELVDGKPVWQGRCEQCMACLQWCPQEAIQYGKSTANRIRYHHPQTNASDFIG